jgi:hypothetical protein
MFARAFMLDAASASGSFTASSGSNGVRLRPSELHAHFSAQFFDFIPMERLCGRIGVTCVHGAERALPHRGLK